MTKLLTILICCVLTITSFAQNPDASLDYKKYVKLTFPELDSISLIHFNNGDFKSAIPYTLAAKDKAKATFGVEDSIYVEYVANMAYYYNELHQAALAEPYYWEARELYGKVLGKEHHLYGMIVNNMARLFQSVGQFDKAEPLFLEVIEIHEKSVGKRNPEYIYNLMELASLYMVKGAYALSEKNYLEAKELQEALIGKNHPNYGRVLNDLASLYQYIGRYNEAEKLYLEDIAAHLKNKLENELSYASVLNNYAGLFHIMGDYKQAEKYFLKSKEIKANKLGKDHYEYALCLNNLGLLYQDMGNYAEAEQINLESVDIRKKTVGKKHPDYALGLNNLALLYCYMGNYVQAEQIYLESKDLNESIYGTESKGYALCLNNLGGLYRAINKSKEAELLYEQAVKIWVKVVGKTHRNYAHTINNLGTVYESLGKYEEAERVFVETLDIQSKTIGKMNPDYALTLCNIARMYAKNKNFVAAEKLYLEALDIHEKTLNKNHPKYISNALYLTNLHIAQATFSKAWITLNQAIVGATMIDLNLPVTSEWSDKVLNVNYKSFLYLDAMVNALTQFYKLLSTDPSISNKKEQQLIIGNLANQLIKKNRDAFVNEEDKLRLMAESHDWMLKSLNVLDLKTQKDKAFELIELNKAALLLEAAKTEKAYQLGSLPDSLMVQEKMLLKKYATLEAALLENYSTLTKDSIRSVLNDVGNELKRFKQKIEQTFPQYAALKYKQVDAKMADVQANLNSETAFVEYVIGDSVLYIVYIDKQQSKIITQTIGNSQLANRIKRMHTALSNYALLAKKQQESYQQYTEQAHWFYQNLIAPLQLNPAIKQLILVPDGELGHVPFETFLVEAAPQSLTNYNQLHYLVNDYKISYNYSATLLVDFKKGNSKKHQNNGKILAFASNYEPSTNATTAVRAPFYQRLRADLSPLPAAQQEIEILSQNFDGTFIVGAQASEKEFKSKAGEFAIIHLAMHGLLDSKAPILSSLVFTEDGDSLENNFLQAYEISKLNLNADLVVLSACETGFGKFEKGNGIASLARAFIYAGASSLIVSLWQVNDAATAALMQNLYQNLAKGMPKDEALQQAKLEFIQHTEGIGAHPAFWSSFILIGDERPIVLASTSAGWGWGLLGGGLVLLVIIGFGFRKKATA